MSFLDNEALVRRRRIAVDLHKDLFLRQFVDIVTRNPAEDEVSTSGWQVALLAIDLNCTHCFLISC
jgi:hypothetical protein